MRKRQSAEAAKPLKDEAVSLWEFDAEAMMRDAVLVMVDMIAAQEKRIRMLEMRLARLEREHECEQRPGPGPRNQAQ